MNNFSWLSFFIGLLILLAGSTIVLFYQKIADSLANGVSSYQKTKFWGVVIMILGFVIMINLHNLILNALIKLIFRR